MYELKTQPNDNDVIQFLNSIENPNKREDSFIILELMKTITKEEPIMWGNSIIGFGSYEYSNRSGFKGKWFLTGFSPRKQNLTLYITSGFSDYEEMLKKLGKHKTGKSCLYINKLKDIDTEILKEILEKSVEYMKK